MPRHANHHAENTARAALPPSGSAPLGKRAGGVVVMANYHKSGFELSYMLLAKIASLSWVSIQAWPLPCFVRQTC